MYIDMYQVKLNMVINLVRDYYTLRDGANVGVLFLTDGDGEKMVLEVNSLNGMAGHTHEIDITEIFDEENPKTFIKGLLLLLKEGD